MITTAITGAITAVLAFFGITPKPQLVAGIWIAVKILMVAAVFLLGLRWARRKAQVAEADADADADADLDDDDDASSPPRTE